MSEGASEVRCSPSRARLTAMARCLLLLSHAGPLGELEQLVRSTRSLSREDRLKLQAVLDEVEPPPEVSRSALGLG